MTGGRLSHSSSVTALGLLDPQGTATLTSYQDAKVTHQRAAAVKLTYAAVPGADEINLIVFQPRTLLAGANEELRLDDGTVATVGLKGLFGETAGFQTIKFISIRLTPNPGTSVTASSITVGNAGTNPNGLWFGAVTHTATIYKNGPPLVMGDPTTGVAVTAGAAAVKILNNDGTNAATYEIYVAGRSN